MPSVSAGRQAAPPVMHLRAMSAYVGTALAEWARQRGRAPSIPLAAQAAAAAGALQGCAGARPARASHSPARVNAQHARRSRYQLRCLASMSGPVTRSHAEHYTAVEVAGAVRVTGRLWAGTSAFGMSGVNAHAILAAPRAAAAASTRDAALLRRRAFWAVPAVSHLVRCARAAAGACVLAIALCSADTAYLLDHQARARGRPLLLRAPGSRPLQSDGPLEHKQQMSHLCHEPLMS